MDTRDTLEPVGDATAAGKLTYWEIRDLIKKAALAGDKLTLENLAIEFPHVFMNVVNQAKNASKTRQ